MEKMDISVVIPAYNEERRILPTLEKAYGYFRTEIPDFEIIVVDDGSKDKTAGIAEKFSGRYPRVKLLRHEKNRGKGAAVRTGVMASKGKLVLFSDADLSTPVDETEKMKKAIDEGCDVVIASRALEGSDIVIPQPLYRRFIGRIFPCFVRLVVMRNFRDTQCGFKLFKGEAAKTLFADLETEGFAFDVEILYRAVRRGMKVKEVPVSWENSDISRVNLLRDPFRMLTSLFLIKRRIR
jgi:dolichyl-phosphate beta-glucosyltransferase